MDTQTQAHIYLADQRGLSENAQVRSYHTFNFGAYRAEGREPFGSLSLLNDDMLSAGTSLPMQVEQLTTVLLLPIMGGLEYQTGSTASDFIEPGQAGILSLPAGGTYVVSNPYETESVNCLHLWLTNATPAAPAVAHTAFDLTQQNTLLPLLSKGAENRVYIGRYGGREEGVYRLADSANGLFVFVLQGVFEVANRLLEEKDGLSLLDPQDGAVEFEALSDDAILLMIDMSC